MTLDARQVKYTPGGDRTRAIVARLDRPVVLVGMMGVGKSTIGRRLASLMGLPFFDADDEIEAAANMPIADIFDQFGEAYFRDGERRVISRLLDEGVRVIATGGGAFVQPETRALILEKGLPVWLDSETKTLVERVTRNDRRPLLRGDRPGEIVARIKAEREPAYSQAPIKVMSDTGPHDAAVQRIMETIDAWL